VAGRCPGVTAAAENGSGRRQRTAQVVPMPGRWSRH